MDIKIVSEWDELLSFFPPEKKDIYYREEYVKLYESAEDTPVCIVCREDDKVLLMPFLKRCIPDSQKMFGTVLYDFETPYGYGGPISNTEDKWSTEALSVMNEFLKENHFVCGFIRFHPLLSNVRICAEHMDIFFDRHTIAVKTINTDDDIWTTQISSKNRNMIRKAEKNNLIYKAEYDFESIKEFIELYNATMKRLEAEQFYFFDDNYYKRFVEQLNQNAFLGTVRQDGKLICGALFMYSEKYGHYHLEGSNHGYSSLGANNLLLWKTACEMRKMGVELFHLGGGYDSEPDNSLFKFKKAFSNNTQDFYIGKDIINRAAYQEICASWENRSSDSKIEKYKKFLLKYRY